MYAKYLHAQSRMTDIETLRNPSACSDCFLRELEQDTPSDLSECSRLQIELCHAFKVINVDHVQKANLDTSLGTGQCSFTGFLKLDVHIHPPITRVRLKQSNVRASIAFDFDLGYLPSWVHLEADS